MSVEHKGNGSLRLRCDGESCPRKFVPLRPFTDPKQLRERAQLFGWQTKATPTPQRSIPGTESKASADLCPECVRGT